MIPEMTKPHNFRCVACRLDAEQQGEWYLDYSHNYAVIQLSRLRREWAIRALA